jgi:hypothetical protein
MKKQLPHQASLIFTPAIRPSPGSPRPPVGAQSRAASYDRARDLPRLLPLWPEELADETREGREALVERLGSLLRQERRRGQAGAWGYDVARHRQLLIAWRSEREGLRRLIWQTEASQTRSESSLGGLINFRAASQGPSSSPASIAPQHSLARPLDNREANSISPDIPQAKDYNAIVGAASGI